MTSGRIDDELVDQWIEPHWADPRSGLRQRVKAWVTTRAGCLSAHPYDGFNTANHVGDDPGHVAANRASLAEYFGWQAEPQWLRQVHGAGVVEARPDGIEREGDAVFSRTPGQVCTLHTADCLPAFFASADGDAVALAHAGWRGLVEGVLERTVEKLGVSPDQLRVWLGPAIGPDAFEVGDDVYQAFVQPDAGAAACFSRNHNGRWQCDIYALARRRLNQAGVTAVTGGNFCTFHETRFFSYRRQGVTGRMLAMIWMEPES